MGDEPVRVEVMRVVRPTDSKVGYRGLYSEGIRSTVVMLMESTGSFFPGGREKVLHEYSTEMVQQVPLSLWITG